MKIRIDNKISVITGAGSGIGEAMAMCFAEAGGKVHILDRDLEGSSRVLALLKTKGYDGVAHDVDVTDQQAIHEVVKGIVEADGAVDILINNAGVAHIGTLESTTEEDFDRVYRVNVKGVYNCMHAVIAHMKRQRSGVIINMASIASHLGLPDRFAYSMSKGAVSTMTYCVARDYVSYGIRCNSISPGRVHTPLVDGFIKKNYPNNAEEMFDNLSKSQPIGRMATPQEVAELALYLASDKSSFITGSDFPIDGGFVKLNT